MIKNQITFILLVIALLSCDSGNHTRTYHLTKAKNELKNTRNETAVQQALYKIRETCANGGNIMPPIIEAAKVYVTLGEIVTAMKAEFGEWQEAAVF